MKKKILSLLLIISLLATGAYMNVAYADPGSSSGTSSIDTCNHEWVDNESGSLGKHCTLCGADYCETVGHTEETPATCTKLAVCEVCKKEYGELAEHTYNKTGNQKCTDDIRCNVCDALIQGGGQHTWTPASCTAPKTCQICDTKEGNPLVHRWGKGTITTQPTENNPGSIRYVCEDCGQIKNQAIYQSGEGDGDSGPNVIIIILIVVIALSAIGAIVYFTFIRKKK